MVTWAWPSAEPFGQIPDVPVIAGNAGLPDDFKAELWNTFIAPADMDAAVIERLSPGSATRPSG